MWGFGSGRGKEIVEVQGYIPVQSREIIF